MTRPITVLLRPAAVLCAALIALAVAPTPAAAQEYFDDMNGVWTVQLGGQAASETALTESYTPGGSTVTLRFRDRVVTLTKSGNDLTNGSGSLVGNLPGGTNQAATVRLRVTGLQTKDPADDALTGTFFGADAVFKRDVSSRAPIVLKLPGDRPWVRFMREVLIPRTAEDRETYHRFETAPARGFLESCVLYETGYWMRKFMRGGATAEGRRSFGNVIDGMSGRLVSPRSITTSAFGGLLRANMAPNAVGQFALARSGLGMYFSTAAGGSVRIPVTDDGTCTIYYITDRRASSKNGLVVMATPAHAPLASSFGRWLLDFSRMDKRDDVVFARCLLETLTESSTRSANRLQSGHGRSAYADYLGVMAIEDQRGVMFANDELSWGYNMTSGSFTALIARALSHGEKRPGPDLVALRGDTAKNRSLARTLELDGREELATQVIVGNELRPGDLSYFDVLNGADDVLAGEGVRGGDDFQEHGGMATLSRLTTRWLREKYPNLVRAAEESVAPFIPREQLARRSKEDVFHLLCENLYDNARFSKVTRTQARRITAAGVALMTKIHAESRDLERFILANGVTKSTRWAPRASGY